MNAGTRITKNSIDIIITAGMIDFIEASISSFQIEMLKKTNSPDEIEGIGFTDWLSEIRKLGEKNTTSELIRLPPGGFTKAPSNKWYLKYMVAPRHFVYTFILAHELSHIYLQIMSEGNNNNQILRNELKCDENALKQLTVGENIKYISNKNNFIPFYIINFIIAYWYYQELNNDWLAKYFAPF